MSAAPAWPLFHGLENSAPPAGEPDVLVALRAAARKRALALPTPDPRSLEWRHLDPHALGGRALTLAPPPRMMAAPPGDPDAKEFDAILTLDGDTWSLLDAAGALRKAGIEIRPLADAAADAPDAVRKSLAMDLPHAPETAFEAWAAARWTWGIHVRAPDGARLERGILIRCRWTGTAGWHAPLILVEAGARSRLTLAEHHTAAPDAGGLVAVQRRLRAGDAAQVAWSHVQTLPDSFAWLNRDIARLGRDARLDGLAGHFGAAAVRTQIGAICAGTGAHAQLGGVFFGAARRRFDHHTVQVHAAPDTTSALLYKGAVQDEAHSVYRGVIAAQRGAVRIDAYQKNANLVLNDGACAEALPGLLIDADDLKCSHGASIGSLDPDQIYYLRCRGLDEHEARRLLLDGYFEDLIARWPAESLRNAARRSLAAQLR